MDEQSDVGSSNKVRLGSLTQLLVSGAQWKGCDDFPAWQSWADHIEKVLAFLEREGRLDSFLLGIQNKKTPQHRDACLAEIYTAFFLVEMGFRILQWEEPPGEGEKKGEFLVGFDGSPEIFVEVKQPGWHSELYPRRQSDNRNLPLEERQRIEPRKQREKYVDGEGGFCEPHKRAMEVVRRNVLPKLKQDFPFSSRCSRYPT